MLQNYETKLMGGVKSQVECLRAKMKYKRKKKRKKEFVKLRGSSMAVNFA